MRWNLQFDLIIWIFKFMSSHFSVLTRPFYRTDTPHCHSDMPLLPFWHALFYRSDSDPPLLSFWNAPFSTLTRPLHLFIYRLTDQAENALLTLFGFWSPLAQLFNAISRFKRNEPVIDVVYPKIEKMDNLMILNGE